MTSSVRQEVFQNAVYSALPNTRALCGCRSFLKNKELRAQPWSPALEPGLNLKKTDDGSPWSLCRRPWSLMYFTANGPALPCCIAPFSLRGYENYTLGDATKQSLQDIWNGPAY